MDRKSFMPGVVLAVKKVSSRPGLTFDWKTIYKRTIRGGSLL